MSSVCASTDGHSLSGSSSDVYACLPSKRCFCTVSLLKRVRHPSVQGAVDLLEDVSPFQLPRGNHEIQPLKICVDFGHMFGTDPRKAALTLIWICHRRWDAWRSLCFLQWLGKVVMWGRSRPTLPCRSVQHAGQSVCGSKLGLDLAVFRLGGVSSTSSPLLIYHFVANLGPSQPLLICRH